MAGRILVVEDGAGVLAPRLAVCGFEITTCLSAAETLDVVRSRRVDVVVARRGTEDACAGLCRAIASADDTLPVVVLTTSDDARAAVEAMRDGAYDCVREADDVTMLTLVLQRALAHRTLALELGRLRSKAQSSSETELEAESQADGSSKLAEGMALVTLEEMQRRHVLHVLEALGGDERRAAGVLGLDLASLRRRLEGWR